MTPSRESRVLLDIVGSLESNVWLAAFLPLVLRARPVSAVPGAQRQPCRLIKALPSLAASWCSAVLLAMSLFCSTGSRTANLWIPISMRRLVLGLCSLFFSVMCQGLTSTSQVLTMPCLSGLTEITLHSQKASQLYVPL